jgi:type IV pilus secretin PilQ/predicted competence protein
MRKNWLSVPVAAAVAAPFLIVLNAHVALAQDGTAVESGDIVTTSVLAPVDQATAPTTGTLEEGAPLGTASSNLDSAAPEAPGSLPDVDGLLPLSAMGDDAIPSLQQARNNPYLRANTAGLETGRTAGGQEYGAFLPPTVTETRDVRQDANQELVNVLGSEVYNRRVNISTPPDTDVEEVVRLLAERADLNFVYGEGVIQGKITLNLRDVPLGVALQSLLSAQDLAIVREGDNVMRIARRADVKPGAKVDMQTVYIKLNWVQADTLGKTLSAAVTGGGGVIQPHVESNTLIITDTAPNIAILRDLVAQLDVPEKQVMIEARMVEMLLRAGRELGSSFDISRIDSNGTSQLSKVGLNDNAGDIIPVDGIISTLAGANGNPAIGFGGVASILGQQFDIDIMLDGLEQRQIVHTLANPRVITLNNQQANIEITRDIPYVEDGQGPTQGSTIQNVEFKQSSVRLNVLPVITNNGYVRMKLEPKQEIFSGFDQITGRVPIIDTRSAITNVIVKDEDTVVLGGLRQISAGDTKREFPWLAKSPVLGWFFKNDNKAHEKNDLMLFVTPHIVKAPQLTPAENYKYTRIDAHWDLPDYFFDDSVDQREANHRYEADMDPRNFYPQDLLLPPPDGAEGSSSAASGVSGYSSTGEPLK